MRRPKVAQQDHTGRAGVGLLQQVVPQSLGWVFREQATSDLGIDGHIEVVSDESATGLLIACQIKAGPSFFKEEDEVGIVYRGRTEHRNYWLTHCLPVILVLCDLDTGTCYWQQITDLTVTIVSDESWKVSVPRSQVLDSSAKSQLEPIALRVLSWKQGQLEWLGVQSYIGPLLAAKCDDATFSAVLLREQPERDRHDARNISEPDALSEPGLLTDLQRALDLQLEAAKRHIDAGQPLLAWELLQVAGSFDSSTWTPGQRFAWSTRLGCCHLAFGRPADAKGCFEEALALRPEYPAAVTNLIIARDLNGDPADESLRLLEPILEANPSLPEAVHTKANLLLTMGEPGQAIALLEEQAKICGDSDVRRDYALTNAYLHAGRFDQAEKLARGCLFVGPGAAEARELLGDVLLTRAITSTNADGLAYSPLSEVVIERQCLTEAAMVFSDAAMRYQAVGRTTVAARCRVNGALCELELGNVAAARQTYQAVKSASPPAHILAPALRGIARIELLEGNSDEAVNAFLAALELEPGDVPTRFNAALVLSSKGRWDEAAVQLGLLREIPDLSTGLRVEIEVLAAQVVRFRDAVQEASETERMDAEAILADAASRFPSAWQVVLEQAQWCRRLNEPAQALALVGRAFDLAPNNLLVLEVAAAVLLEQKQWSAFAEMTQRLIEGTREVGRPNRSIHYHNCAVALIQLGEPAEALRLLESASAETFPAEDLLQIRASALKRLYRFQEAGDCWRKLLQDNPNDVQALVGFADVEWSRFNLHEAYTLLNRAESLGDQDATAYLNLMTIARELEAKGEAVRWAEAAVAVGADTKPEMFIGAIAAAHDATRWDLVSRWIAAFRTRWPDSDLIWTLESPSRRERDQQVAEYRAARDERIRLAWQAYECLPIPLAQLSYETGLPIASLWEQIIQCKDGKYEIRCHIGTPGVQAAQVDAACNAEQVSVDLTALLTLELLGTLYLLPRMYQRVVIPEYFYIELRNSVLKITEPAVRFRLRKIIAFLTREPSVILANATEAEELLGDDMGKAIPLLTDEAALQHEIGRRGGLSFSTYGFLGAAHRRELIDDAEYARCKKLLFAHSYGALPVSPGEIAATIRSDPRPSNLAACRMLQRITRTDINYLRVGQALAGVLWSMASDWVVGCEDLRVPWIDKALAAAHADDPDHFRLQQTIYYCARELCERGDDAATASFVGQLHAWFKTNRIDRIVLARGIGQAARHCGKQSQPIKTLVRKLASSCPEDFRRTVRREALPDFRLEPNYAAVVAG